MIQLVGNDAVTSATGADRKWLATHVRVVDGKTVIDVGGQKHKLPKADLSKLVRNAA